MEILPLKSLPTLPKLKLAVVGHVEWVTFLTIDKYPQAGEISHGKIYLEEPAGGGAVAAVKMARLTGGSVHFFTALGKDSEGKKSEKRLRELGLKLHISWKNQPTRKGISMIDSKGERAITVIGDRLQASGKDQLPWNELTNFDGVFVTATDSTALKHCRAANILVASPRLGPNALQRSTVKLDAIIGSGLDPDESLKSLDIKPSPNVLIATEGSLGGECSPGGHFEAVHLKSPPIDTYGCGDSFAAGVTTGLSAGWSIEKAISLGSHCGAQCVTNLGPYES